MWSHLFSKKSPRLDRIFLCATRSSSLHCQRHLPPRHHPRSLTSKAASTSTSTTSTDFDRLEQASRKTLHSNQTETMESLIQEWGIFLDAIVDDTEVLHMAVERLYDLYRIMPVKTLQCHQILLTAYSQHVPDGTRALAILEQWNRQFEGNLDRSPSLESYHAVLKAFINAGSDESDKMVAAQVAREIWILLNEWGYAMEPNSETLALVAQCVAPALLLEHDDDSQDQNSLVLWDTLEQVVHGLWQRALQPNKSTQLRPLALDETRRVVHTMCRSLGIVTPTTPAHCWKTWHSWLQQLLSDPWVVQSLRHDLELSSLEPLLEQALTAVQRCAAQQLQGAERAHVSELLFPAVQQLFPGTLPNMLHLQLAVKAWRQADVININNETRMSELLQQMEDLYRRRITQFNEQERTEWMNRLMMAHYDASNHRRVYEIFHEMTVDKSCQRNNLSFSVMLKTLADEGTIVSAERAHGIWKRMVAKPRKERFAVVDAQHFASVMVAWSKSRHPKAASFCQQVFDQLVLEAADDKSLVPTSVHYSALIASWGWQKSARATETIVQLYHDMTMMGIEPDAIAYTSVLGALARTRTVTGALRAEEMLDGLEARNVELDRRCYVSVMYAWARSTSPDAPEKCEAILNRLRAAFAESGNVSLKPSSIAYRALIEAWIDTDAQRAGKHAEAILRQVEEETARGKAEPPDNHLFTGVMMAHLKSRDSQNAVTKMEQLLEKQLRLHQQGKVLAKPSSQSITVLLQGLAQSKDPNKALKSRNLLRGMCEAYRSGDLEMRPRTVAFATVMNACAFTVPVDESQQAELVHIAVSVMNEFDDGKYDEPTSALFRGWLQVLRHHVLDVGERSRLASNVFQRCCQEGCVDGSILKEMEKLSPELQRNLPAALPVEWSRRVGRQVASSS